MRTKPLSVTDFFASKMVLNSHTGLEHATIRDNIIFGSSFGYDETKYQAVIEACALSRDLDLKMIFTAHHRDDQIETFFLRLSHGSGVDGLAGIQSVSFLNSNLCLVRPLLSISKVRNVFQTMNFDRSSYFFTE